VRVWNGLSAEQRHFSSLIQFKNLINSVDLSNYISLGFSVMSLIFLILIFLIVRNVHTVLYTFCV